jgi:superfamily II DNA or RNA helicase
MSELKLKRMIIGKGSYIHFDTIVTDEFSGQLIFASIVDNDQLLKNAQYEVNKKNTIFIESLKRYVSSDGKYDIEKRKASNSDFGHLVVNKRDDVEELGDDNELLKAYIYVKDLNELNSKLYDKLYANTSIPLLEEWMPYIKQELMKNQYLRQLHIETIYEQHTFEAFRLYLSKAQLLNLVQTGIREHSITINNTSENSELMGFIDGLDSYLNVFGDTLAHRIQESFTPKFNPSMNNYDDYVNNYDDSCFHAGIELYGAQKATIQAAVNNLKVNNVTFVIGEMGCGKTAVGSGIAYAHYGKKSGMTNVVMCPSHLVEKWKREVERLVPNARGYIIREIGDLIRIESKIKNKAKVENTYLIISKETAKFSYETRPAGVWSRSKKTYLCPCCGQPLTKKERIGSGRRAETIIKNFEMLDFQNQLVYNSYCMNDVRYYDTKESKFKTRKCNTALWVPLNKEDKNTGWLKLGKEGWIMKNHVDDLYTDLMDQHTLTRKEGELFKKIVDVRNAIADGEEMKGLKAPRKYSIAKYIRERFAGSIDYFLADELHLYKGDSKQGQAMADIATAAKNFIGLTGTLLNGYADGLFYILYRTLPKLMKYEGFEYKDEANFMRAYGVIKKNSSYRFTNGTRGERVGLGSEKKLPGVSPIVFTKFLLENSVFLSLSDMDGGLPGYEEIPISVEMDQELKDAYGRLESDLREACSWNCSRGTGNGGMKIMGSLLQTLSVYPDMPYNQPEILHPDTGEVLVVPPTLPEGLRNKENELLRLVQEKIANGEKVLVYYEWTNRTDLAQKLSQMFKDNDIKSVVLTSSVNAAEREDWIDKQLDKGIDVLICNPKLVETGLDLLSFTTIVFYQIGYNIFTMRQASRRSWRLSQTEDIKVYFIYYKNTIQDQALSLMATKLQASMAIEGKFSEEGLRAMSNNEDLLTQIANSVVEGIKDTVQVQSFVSVDSKERQHDTSRTRTPLKYLLVKLPTTYNLPYLQKPLAINKKKLKSDSKGLSNMLTFNSLINSYKIG